MKKIISELSFRLVEEDNKISLECTFVDDLKEFKSLSDIIIDNKKEPAVSKSIVLLNTLAQYIRENKNNERA